MLRNAKFYALLAVILGMSPAVTFAQTSASPAASSVSNASSAPGLGTPLPALSSSSSSMDSMDIVTPTMVECDRMTKYKSSMSDDQTVDPAVKIMMQKCHQMDR